MALLVVNKQCDICGQYLEDLVVESTKIVKKKERKVQEYGYKAHESFNDCIRVLVTKLNDLSADFDEFKRELIAKDNPQYYWE